MPVEAETYEAARVIWTRGNEHFVKPVHMAAIAGHIQRGRECAAYQPAISAGFAEAAGCPAGSGGLAYSLRLAADEVATIALVADDITELAGKGE